MIYITGANGQLGSELRLKLGDKAIFLSRNELDLSSETSVESFLQNTNLSLLINAGAYTQVDNAESERELALTINSKVPKMMARYAKKKNFKLIHFSTDYVFDGQSNVPYKETDHVSPINFYGQAKLDGEVGITQENEDALIIRTSWLYSTFGKNFIKTILKFGAERDKLNVVYDQVGTLTSVELLADVVLKAQELKGIYHFANEGVSSWYDVAVELKRIKGFKADIMPILSHEYPTPAKRPNYSVLNKNKIKDALGITIPHWTESLELCLKKIF